MRAGWPPAGGGLASGRGQARLLRVGERERAGSVFRLDPFRQWGVVRCRRGLLVVRWPGLHGRPAVDVDGKARLRPAAATTSESAPSAPAAALLGIFAAR